MFTLLFFIKNAFLKMKLMILISYLSTSLIVIITEESAFEERFNSETAQFNLSSTSANIKKCGLHVKQKEREKDRTNPARISARNYPIPFTANIIRACRIF